ncbi:MAG TPA: hypothetical protein VIG08_17580 [Gemmatimonadales bacterium]|jgi:hypothetical protein
MTSPEPDVVSILKQPKGNITYRIVAHRPLNKAEMIQVVAEYYRLPGMRGKKPAENSTVTIVTPHGSE